MNDELEAVRINASRGPVWTCSKKQAQLMGWKPTQLLEKILERDCGVTAGKRWIDSLRIRLFNDLFGNADYGQAFQRTTRIQSAYHLTSGEAIALHDFLFSDIAEEALADWLENQEDVPRAERLI